MKTGKISFEQLQKALEKMNGNWGLQVINGEVELVKDEEPRM